jgi:hypothetical protein
MYYTYYITVIITGKNSELNRYERYVFRVFMIMACITSGIGVICLFILLIFNKKFKSISYISGLSLAFLLVLLLLFVFDSIKLSI